MNKLLITNKNAFKYGEAVAGVKAVIPSKNGKEEAGLIIYKRKAEYKDDPYMKRA